MEIDMHSRSLIRLSLGVARALACIACDDGGPGSCTMTQTLGTETTKICEEVPAGPRSQLREKCNATSQNYPPDGIAAATYADGPCPHVGSLGGCKMTADGMSMTLWYYGGSSNLQTPDDVKQLCADAGDTYVAP